VQSTANYGRYTVVATITQNGTTQAPQLISIPYGPNVYDVPRPASTQGECELYMDMIATPPVLSLSEYHESQILVWVENVSTATSLCSFDLTVEDPTENIQFSPLGVQTQSSDDLFSVTISSLQLGPQEGVVIPFVYNVPSSTAVGGYSFSITVSPTQGGTPTQQWLPIELSN
jgi:hypothetical protein